MFSAKGTDSNPFRPALQYLLSGASQSRTHHRPNNSASSLDSDGESTRVRMGGSSNPKSSTEFRSSAIPLISISRSPSPYRRRHSDSNPTSDTDDDDWGDSVSSSRRPFLQPDSGNKSGWNYWIYGGGCGHYFFNTTSGWQIYIGVLVLWLGGCQIGVVLMNRIILWTGVYKFPYPVMATLLELVIAHLWIVLSAYLTRWFSPWLVTAGLSGGIAPSGPLRSSSSPGGFRGSTRNGGFLSTLSRWTQFHEGGIAGGGFFEFDWQVVKTVLPCAVIFVAKVLLSNLSFAGTQLPIYVLARIGIVPLSLFFSYFLTGSQLSVSVVSSCLTATLTLIVVAARANIRVTWDPIVAGVVSSIFVALYPVQIQRTLKALVAQLVPQGDLLGTFPASSQAPQDFSGTEEEARAYWRLLHYTSVLSLLILTPIVLLSGEIRDISWNCYILDVPFHWLMILCGGLGSWAIFWATIALTRATSPLTTTFLFIPRANFLLPIMAGWEMPASAWIGVGMCWASCAWFLRGQRRESRSLERLR